MKTTHKALNIVRATMLGMALAVAGVLGAHNSDGPKGQKKSSAAIQKDVSSINAQKARVATWKKKMKEDCKAGNKEAAVIDRREWRKAKADLKRDKSYLVADTKDLSGDDNLAISNWKKIVSQDEANLKASRKQLDKANTSNDNLTLSAEKAKVDMYEKKLQSDKNSLESEKQKKNEDMTFVKDEVKQLDGNHSWFYFTRL
jgi:hypothetical protein